MEKYKLIKEYPNSPELGTIIETRLIQHNKSRKLIDITEYPDNWELQKEYEILTLYFQGVIGDICYLDKVDNLYKYTGTQTGSNLEVCLSSGWKINTVERISDGEIFFVGEVIDTEFNSKLTINGFRVLQNGLMGVSHTVGRTFLKNIKKKVKLFTSTDGVDIYKGDNYWETDSENFIKINNPNIVIGKNRVFSTKKLAIEDVVNNEKIFSMNDLIKLGFKKENLQDLKDISYTL